MYKTDNLLVNYYKLIITQCTERIINYFPFSPHPFPHSEFPCFLSTTPLQDFYPCVKLLEHQAGYSHSVSSNFKVKNWWRCTLTNLYLLFKV